MSEIVHGQQQQKIQSNFLYFSNKGMELLTHHENIFSATYFTVKIVKIRIRTVLSTSYVCSGLKRF